MVTFDIVREMALALPGMEEGLSYGTPAFRVRGTFVARLREDGGTLVLKVGFDEREMLMKADPDVYFITEHYRSSPSIIVRLSHAQAEEMNEVLEQAWRRAAPRRLVASYDAESGGDTG